MSQAKAESDNDAFAPQGQRLPSSRPIDRRWNHSRGIILSNAKRNASGNFAWSQDDGIVFASAWPSRRGYASRKLFNPQSNVQPSPSKTTQGLDFVSDPYRISSDAIPSNFGNLAERLNQEKSSHESTKQKHSEEIARILQQHQTEKEKSKEERTAEVDFMLKDRIRELNNSSKKSKLDQERNDSEHKRNTDRKKELQRQSKELEAKERTLISIKQELDNTISKAYREAEDAAQVKYQSRMESVERLERDAQRRKQVLTMREEDAASEAQDRQQKLTAKTDRLEEEGRQDLQQHKKALDRVAAETVAREIQELRKGPILRHDVERKDYEAYHAVWDEIGDEMAAYVGETGLLAKRLGKLKEDRWEHNIRAFNHWKNVPRLSDRWKNPPQTGHDASTPDTSFSQAYPSLSKQLDQFLEHSAQEASKKANDLKDLRQAAIDARSTLNVEAHFSRRLTKYHHFEEGSNMYARMSLVASILNEDPLTLRSEELKDRCESLVREIKATASESSKEPLRRELQTCKSKSSQISKLKRFYRHFRLVQALDALLHDSISEKAIFAVTQQARDLQDEAWSDWSESVDEDVSELSREQLRSDRDEFRKLYAHTRKEREDVARLIRQRILLEEHLEEIKDETVFDTTIEKELEQAKRNQSQWLENLIGTGASGSAAFVRQAPAPRTSAVRQVAAVRQATPQVEPTARTEVRPLIAVEAGIARLKQKLKQPEAYESAEEKEKDTRELNNLKIIVIKRQIDRETTRKAATLRKSPDDHAGALRIQKIIDGMAAGIAKLMADAKSPTGNVEGLAVKAEVASPPASSPRIGGFGRNRVVIRKHRSFDQRRSASSDATVGYSKNTADKEDSTSGFTSFKPTAAMQTSPPYWSEEPRSLRAGSFNSSRARSASPSGLSSKGSSLTSDHPVGLSQAIRQLSLESSRAETHQHVPVNINKPFGFFSSNNTSSNLQLGSDDTHRSTKKPIDLDSTVSSIQSFDISSDSDISSEQSSAILSEESSQDFHEAEQRNSADMQVELVYQMPPDDYRNALLASRNSNAAYWSHKLYKNANSKTPLVFYCVNYDTTEARAREFLNERIIGFDIEWEPHVKKENATVKQNVSLIQIAAEDKIGLFHIALFAGDTPDRLVPPSLRSILESRNIAKTGVNISGDANRLRQHLDVNMQGLFELSHLYRVVELSPSQVNRKLVKLSEQVQNILGLPLKKDSVQTSAWSKRLSLEQTEYAASDAYAGFRLYHSLEAKRRLMRPMPPLPAFWEDKKPLLLGDGKAIVPRPYVPKRKREVLDIVDDEAKDDEDECAEYFDTVEDLETDSVDPIAAHDSVQSFASSDDSSLSLSESEEATDKDDLGVDQPQWSQTESQATSSLPVKPHAHHHKAAKSNHPSSSPEVRRADLWVTSWRASLPVEYNLKVGNPTLRAYHMWHEQGLNCYDVAALLRDPPLAPQTVASYVMTALKEEDLPFDAERVKEPLGILPKSVHGRYRKVLEKIGCLKD